MWDGIISARISMFFMFITANEFPLRALTGWWGWLGMVMRYDRQSTRSARVVSVAVNWTQSHWQCGVNGGSDRGKGNDWHLLRERERGRMDNEIERSSELQWEYYSLKLLHHTTPFLPHCLSVTHTHTHLLRVTWSVQHALGSRCPLWNHSLS